jgi:WD40 repeat protein
LIDCCRFSNAVILAERRDAKQWISDAKFSSDSRTLVVAAHDCKVYIYAINIQSVVGKNVTGCEMQLRGTFCKHNSVVTHVDLSQDGRFMQSNCAAYELLFCDVSNGRQIPSASELRDTKWHTQSCTLGWNVQGIWRAGIDGSDINAVRRSHSGHLLAVVDDFGKVSLYRCPTLDSTQSKCWTYSGHSSHVMNVAWSCGDECLLSVGGNDKCILQWRHRVSSDVANFSTTLIDTGKKRDLREKQSKNRDDDDDDDDIDDGDIDDESSPFELEASGGDESGAVKPWLGAIRAPKNPPAINASAPSISLTLRWVHGFSCSQPSQRNDLFYNAAQQLIYPVAALSVLLDRPKHSSKSDSASQSG